MALTILALGVVTLIQLSSQSLRVVKVSGDYQQAAQLANRIATQNNPTDEGVESGQEGPFQWERRTTLVPLPDEFQPKVTLPGQEPAKLFAVTIAVHWGNTQALEVATLYTPSTPPSLPQPAASSGQQPTSPSTATRATGAAQPPRTQ